MISSRGLENGNGHNNRRGTASTAAGGDERHASVRHVLHTFSPGERLGEHRLGLSLPEPALTAHNRRQPGAGEGGDDDETVRRRNGRGIGEQDGAERDRARARSGSSLAEGQGLAPGGAGGGGVRGGRRGGEGGRGGGGVGLNRSVVGASVGWKARWIYRDKKASALEADEIQLEVRVEL